MAIKIELKRSAVPGKVPSTSSLDLGEVAINTYDGKLYFKKDNGAESIIQLADVSGSVVSASYAVTASYAINTQNIDTGSLATTGSNRFNGNQTITGSLIQGLEGNIATGERSHAEGSITKAIGDYSHAEGDNTQAKGDYSHAEGQETIASGSYSHAEGYQTIALANHQHVQGQYNAVSSIPSAFIVGNGTDDSNRSNLIHAAGNVVEITGSLNVSNGITGSLEGTASYANNADTLDGIHGSQLVLTSSFNSYTASINNFTSSITTATGSLATTASFNAYTSSINSYTSSLNLATSSFVRNSQTSSMSVLSASYAATASFASNFTVTNTLTAQTLVVQTVTSSIIYSSGSNRFGNDLTNTQVFTGSVIVTGSLSLNGSNVALTNQTSSFATTASFNAYTSSINSYTSSLNSKTSSFATTGSNNFIGIENITGSLNVSGSTTFTGGSGTTLLSTNADTLIFTGSLFTSGSASLSGSVTVSGSLSVNGSNVILTNQTGAFTLNSQTSSFATTASFNSYTSSINSYTSSLNSITSSFATSASFNAYTSSLNSATSSFATTSSFNAYTSSLNAATSSFVLNSQTSSMSVLSASYAATASNILGGKATHIPFFETDTTLATSSLYQSGSTSIIINQDANTTANPEALYVYQPHPTSINVVSGKGNLDNYLQLNIQNTNQGASASSDIVATANNGNESTNYIDMGINSENYNSGFVGDANDAYLYSTGNHLHIGNVSNFPVQLFAGGSNSNLNTKLSLYPNNQHELTGSLDVSGSLKVLNGVTGSFSGSLAGTASFSNNATSASFATTSSFVPQAIITASAVDTTITFTRFDGSTFNVTTIQSGSVASASFAENARSASYALTASYALNTQQIDTASFTPTSSFNAYTSSINTYTSSLNAATGAFTTYTNFNAYTSSINNVTSSFVLNSQTSSFVQNSQTGAFATFTALNAYTSSTNNFTSSILSYTSSLNAATGAFATFTALNAYTSSTNNFSASINNYTASQNNLNGTYATTSSLNAYTSSINSYTSSLNAATSSFVLNSQTSSMSVLSASYAQTASFASNFTVTNTLTAQTLIVQTVSSSVVYSSGSNVFGNSLSNTQVLTGSVLVTGSLSVNGSDVTLTNQTGAFATFIALNDYTSSINTYTQSLNSITSSFATSASFNAYTSSLNSKTSSFATTGSNIFVGNQTITGSFTVTGSTTQIGNNTLTGNTSLTGSVNISGSTNIFGTTVFRDSSTTITGSLLISGSTTQIGNNNLFGNTTLSGSVTISGSANASANFTLQGHLRLDPGQDPGPNNYTASFLFTSASNTATGYDLYYRQDGNLIKFKWIEGGVSTGLLYGGNITYSGSTIFIKAGSGVINNMNATTGSEINPILTYVTWNDYTSSATYLTSSQNTYLYVDASGSIFQQTSFFNQTQYEQAIPLGRVTHPNYILITGVGSNVQTTYDNDTQQNDFIRAFGPVKVSGFSILPQPGSLSLGIGNGIAYNLGGFYSQDPNSPSHYESAGFATASIARAWRSGSGVYLDNNGGSFYTTVDPDYWDDGTGTLNTMAAGDWQIQRVFNNPVTGRTVVYYGQNTYTTLLNALQYLATDSFEEGEFTAKSLVFVGYLVLKGQTNDLTDDNNNRIINAGIFRNIAGGSSGGAAVTQTLNDLSDVNITTPSNYQALVYDSGTWINGNPLSSSYATTSSFVPTGIVTASAVNTTITFTRFNGSTFDVIVSQSGSVASASYAENTGLLDGLDSTQFTLTSSFNTYTASINTYTQSLNAATGAFATFTALNSYTSSLNTYTQSLNAATGAFVTYANFNSTTSSLNNFSASILTYTASQNNLNGTYATTSSLNAYTASINTYTGSLNAATGAFATFTALNAYTSSTNDFSASILSYTQSLNAATGAYATFTALNNYTSSTNNFSASILSYTASVNNFITGINSYTSSLNLATSSFVLNSQTSSMSVLSASYAQTSSYASNFTVANILTAQTLVVQTVSSSVIYSSGSNVFGNDLTNTQVFTGSVSITGSASVNGSNIVLANQTSSLVTYTNFNSYTSSLNTYTQSLNSATGAFATFTALNDYTSSINTYTSSLNNATSSFVTYTNFNATTASLNNFSASILSFTASQNVNNGTFATTSSFNAYTSSINTYTSSINTVTSSFVLNSQTSSMTVLSASYATTSSYSRNLIVAGTLTFDVTLTDYASITSTIVGSNNLFTQPTSSYTSGFFKYTVKNGTNARTGEVMAVWNGTSVEYTDMSTRDLGNTADVTFAASIVTGNLQFNVTTATSGWNIKTLATYI